MAAPGRGADELQRGFLERPGHEEAVDDLDAPQAFQHGPPGGQRADPQAGRGDLGQRADVDDDAVGVVGGQRRGQRSGVVVDEPAGEVVLDHERPGRAGDGQHLRAAGRGEDGPGGVLEERLGDEDPGAGGPEGVGEQLRADPVGVHRDGYGAQSGGAGGGEHAGVGGRLHQDRRAGRGERAQGGGQRALAARGDQDVGAGEGGPDLAGEPGPQLGQSVRRGAAPGARPAAGAGQRGGEGPLGLERGVEVAAVELDDAGRRGGEGDQHPGGVDRTRHHLGPAVAAQRHLLPGRVAGGGQRGAGAGAEGAGAGAGGDEPFGGELGDGAGDGDGADPEPFDESPARRELSTR